MYYTSVCEILGTSGQMPQLLFTEFIGGKTIVCHLIKIIKSTECEGHFKIFHFLAHFG